MLRDLQNTGINAIHQNIILYGDVIIGVRVMCVMSFVLYFKMQVCDTEQTSHSQNVEHFSVYGRFSTPYSL